jgi:DHA2 family multidrug resistance protein
MFMFGIFCVWGYKILTPDTGEDAFFWVLVFRGAAMGLLFIPVTTLSLSTLKGREIGDGAAFTGMMRQLGGSFGIALITTLMAKNVMLHRSNLVSHLDTNNPIVQNQLEGMARSFVVKGLPTNIAHTDALQAMDFMVMKQAMLLTYMDVFWFIGMMFFLCVPFVLMVKDRKNNAISISDALH